jgi:hypothetical protein
MRCSRSMLTYRCACADQSRLSFVSWAHTSREVNTHTPAHQRFPSSTAHKISPCNRPAFWFKPLHSSWRVFLFSLTLVGYALCVRVFSLRCVGVCERYGDTCDGVRRVVALLENELHPDRISSISGCDAMRCDAFACDNPQTNLLEQRNEWVQ